VCDCSTVSVGRSDRRLRRGDQERMTETHAAATTVATLAGVPLFASLPHAALAEVAAMLQERALRAGELLFREGERGDELFIVLAGQLLVIKALGTPDERQLGLRGPGEFVGDLSLLGDDIPRSATVRAEGGARLLRLGRAELHALLDRHPALATTMLNLVGARLTAAHAGAIRDLHERNERLERAYAELQAAQAQLIEKEKLERDLQVAYDIQMSILPRSMPAVPGFQFGARIVPARIVGGDFFDFVPLGPGTLGVAVGDVTDKGLPAAIFMAQARALLRAEACSAASPREALERVNRHLLQMNDAGLFVTVLYGVLDLAGGLFRYARAGHELPLLSDAGGAVTVAPRGSGMALGLVERPPIDEQALAIPPGATLLLYTDGATEAHDPQYEEFGVARLAATLAAHHDAAAGALCDLLLGAITAFQQTAHQHDDITLVAIRAAGA
jgi:phosphoserine phosphatase RsbU/P